VPSSFCGLFGLKPTYGRLSRARSFPFVSSFDHLGPLARSTQDLALAYDAMQGPDAEDPVCVDRPVEPTTPALRRGTHGLRVAVAGGYFKKGMFPEACVAMDRVRLRSAPIAISKSPRRSARAPRPMSSRPPKAQVCISAACACVRMNFDPATRDR